MIALLFALGCGSSSSSGVQQDQQGQSDQLAADIEPDQSSGDLVADQSFEDKLLADDALADLAIEDQQTDTEPSVDQLDAVEDQADLTIAPPPQLFLTINQIGELMNGSKPLNENGQMKAYNYLVPRSGFTLDILPRQDVDNGLLDPKTLTVTCDQAIGEGNQIIAAGTELADKFTFDQQNGSFSWRVPEELLFPITVGQIPAQPVNCTASVADIHGQHSASMTYGLHVAEMTDERNPFEKTDVWLITFSRDNWTIGTPQKNPDGSFSIPHTKTSNGVADFDEDLTALGFKSDKTDESLFIRKWLMRLVRRDLYEFYKLGDNGEIGPDSVNIKFYFEGDPGAPKPGDPGVSVIAVGGWDASSPDLPANGRANLDWNNKVANNDAVPGLGVFTTVVFDRAISIAIAALLLKPLMPGVGQPIGYHPADSTLWKDGFDPDTITDVNVQSRYASVKRLVELGSLGISSILAHEIGHSLGLVPDGLPPVGLFGGIGDVEFTVSESTGAHIDTPGLNVMQSGNKLDVLELVNGRPFFNKPNLAYLLGRIIVTP